MTVTLETFGSCPSCGHKIRFIAVTTIRVNKRSIRATGSDVMLGAFEDWRCPGCREEIPRDGALEREPYRLVPEDEARVADYRRRKWGIGGEAVPVEVPMPQATSGEGGRLTSSPSCNGDFS